MVNLKVNNIPVAVEEGTTILGAAAKAGVSIPTLCFLKEINEIGACRVCVVEIKGKESWSPRATTSSRKAWRFIPTAPRYATRARLTWS